MTKKKIANSVEDNNPNNNKNNNKDDKKSEFPNNTGSGSESSSSSSVLKKVKKSIRKKLLAKKNRKKGFRKRVITKHLEALKVLQSLGPVNLNALLPHLTGALHKSICDCAHNVVNNSKNILSAKDQKHLKPKLIPHRKNLRKLTEPKL